MIFGRSVRVVMLVGFGSILVVSCGSSDKARVASDQAGAAGQGPGGAGPDLGGSSSVPLDAGAAGEARGGAGPNAGAPAQGGAAGVPGNEATAGAAGSAEPTAMCSDFPAGQPPTKPTAVWLVNNTNANIYFGSPAAACAYHFDFQVYQGQTELQPSRAACAQTCAELQSGGCDCADPCVSIVTLVAPGKHLNVGWPGTIFTTKKMPRSCLSDASCSSSADACLVEESAPQGPLTIQASAYPDKECSGANCPDCTPGYPTGTCIVSGAVRTKGTPLTASASWNAESVVQISFAPP